MPPDRVFRALAKLPGSVKLFAEKVIPHFRRNGRARKKAAWVCI
jgi:hypothetical protein